MKKQIILIYFITFAGVNLFSQEDIQIIKEGKEFDYQKYQEIFSDIDTDKVTTGFLADKVFQLIPFDNYNGSDTAQTVSYVTWRYLYSQIQDSQTKSQFVSIDSIYEFSKTLNRLESFVDKNDNRNYKRKSIPISVIDVSYNEIKSDAFEKNILQVEDSKIKNTNSKENPYLTKNLYVATALKDKIFHGSNVSFVFEDTFYYTNKDTKNSIYEIDFDDGYGFREIEFGQTINVSYSCVGEKTLKLKKTDKNNQRTSATLRAIANGTLITTFTVLVQALSIPQPTFTIPESELTFQVPSNYPYGGVQAKGKAYVRTSDGTTNIKNPIIIMNGFDPENEKDYDEIYDLMNRQNFAECLHTNGYDLIILVFSAGGTYIERNAYVLKGLIENINARKTTQNQLVIVGPSMGGLISRYALAYMEKNNINHDTRLFVSFDSPQNGANIPLGVQYWFQFFSSMNSTVKGKYDNLLCSPAARQMLVCHAAYFPSFNNPARVAFEQSLNNIGYPSKLRKIAIANGSGNAYGQRKDNGTIFNPTDQIVKWTHRHWKVDIDGNSWAVPNISPYTKIFDGMIDIVWFAFWEPNDKSMTVHISGTYPYDNSPGGTTNTMGEMAASDTDGYGTIETDISNHSFIPTVSSLAINTSDLFHNISTDPNIMSKTPFNAIYYPVNTNEEHVYISEACVSWLFNELVPDNIELSDNSWNTGEVRAGNSITLKPGFSTVPGKTFHAYISPLQPCNTSASTAPPLPLSAKSNVGNPKNETLTSYQVIDLNKGIVVFPNPSNGNFYVRVNENESVSSVTVRNIQGATILRKENTSQSELHLDISEHPAGTYFVSIAFKDSQETIKIIKQ